MTPLQVFLLPFVIFIFFLSMGGLHIVHEGHIGIYSRGGALLSGFSEPGMHLMVPLITRFDDVQVHIDKLS